MPDSPVSLPTGAHDAAPARTYDASGATAAKISTGAVQLLSDYTGRGPTKAHTIINRDSVTIVLQDTLTKGERHLVRAGREAEVRRTRHAYQEIMQKDLTALVETQIERSVIAFLSANHADPDVAVEFFMLESVPREAGAATPAVPTG
jgi:uncharacterized protein YbcI